MDKHTVFGSDGSVNVEASTLSYVKALNEWKVKNELPTEDVEAAVEAVFDRFPGYRLSMPALLHEAVSLLKGEPSQHKTLTARVQSYIASQCGIGDARNTGRIDITKGKAGGVLRLARPGQPVPVRIKKDA
jgi:hypothetical protein